MVHSEVYLKKCVVSMAPFSAPAYPDCSQNITYTRKTALFCMFSLFNFSSIFPGGSADPICPYVRTPMLLYNFCYCLLRTDGYFRLSSSRSKVLTKTAFTQSALTCFKWEIPSGNTSRHAGCRAARLSVPCRVSFGLV